MMQYIWPIAPFALIIILAIAKDYRKISEAVLVVGNAKRLSKNRPQRPNRLTVADLKDARIIDEAFLGLCDYAKHVKPDWILGINYAGRVLSVAIAEKIGMPQDRCATVTVDIKNVPAIQFQDDSTEDRIEGRVLVVDDISRTGSTISSLRTFFLKNNRVSGDGALQIVDLHFATLLVASQVGSGEAVYMPSWTYGLIDSRSVKLPWSETSGDIRDATLEDQDDKSALAVLGNWKDIVLQFSRAAIEAKRYFEKHLSVPGV
jgi:hypothetical protein